MKKKIDGTNSHLTLLEYVEKVSKELESWTGWKAEFVPKTKDVKPK